MNNTPTPETDAAEMTASIIAVNLPPASARFVHAEFARDLERKLAAERALADRLADALVDIQDRASDATIMLHPDDESKGCIDDCWEWSEQALNAWKEARKS